MSARRADINEEGYKMKITFKFIAHIFHFLQNNCILKRISMLT